MKRILIGMIVVGLFVAAGLRAEAGTTWTASSGGNWTNTATWGGGGLPQQGDDAIINAAKSVTVDVTTAYLNNFTNNGTLTFLGTNTALQATNIVITATGNATHPMQTAITTNPADGYWYPDSRVWFVCSNLTVAAGGGKIDVSTMGYQAGLGTDAASTNRGRGPGGGTRYGGGGYGGNGAWHVSYPPPLGSLRGTYPPGATYGSVTNPVDPGSGGGGNDSGNNNGGPGGGAVLIQASGAVTINGAINANGGNYSGYGGGGSGGGINIACLTFGGTGVLSAIGGGGSIGPGYGGGGGGRIAINYNKSAQAIQGAAGVTITVAGGNNASTYAQPGTIYVPDFSLLAASPLTVIPHTGRLFTDPALTNWTLPALTISNAALTVPTDGFQLTVSNDLTIVGSSATASSLEIGTRATRVCGSVGQAYCDFVGVTTNGPSLAVGGRLFLTNNASLYVFSGMTNSTWTNYGARVSVTGDVVIASNCWVYPYSHYTNGGSVFFQAADLLVGTNGGINASAKGWAGGCVGDGQPGYGPGAGKAKEIGAGYGGNAYNASAGNGGQSYGSSNAPALPGSGGSAQSAGTCGGDGGGLIWVQTSGDIILNGGALKADGGQPVTPTYAGRGSGGGIYLTCRTFGGPSGTLSANAPSSSGNGIAGGGRIAVWRLYDTCQFTNNISVASGGGSAVAGTLVWGQQPAPPAIANLAASNISYTVATLNGSLSSAGTAQTTVWVYWGLSDQSTNKAAWDTNGLFGVTASPTTLITNVVGLAPGTNYYYRFYASNSVGETWATPTTSFATPAPLPTVSNALFGATNITLTSACLNGYLFATGLSATVVSVYWGPSDAGTNVGASWAATNTFAGYPAVGPLSMPVSLPASNTWYYYRYSAQNSGGRAWADPVSSFMAGEVGVQATTPNASMNGLVPGTFTVFRAASMTGFPITVNYAVSGTAALGTQYGLSPIGTSVVMNAGVSNLTIAVNPIWDDTMLSAQTVSLTLLPSLYAVSAQSNATVNIAGAVYSAGSNGTVQAGDWAAITSWSQGHPPVAGDAVYIAHNLTVTNATRALASLTVNTNKTLTFYGTNTSVTATTVTLYGTVTHAVESALTTNADGNWYADNRVWLVCSNLNVTTSGAINVTACGYKGGLGGTGHDAGYGPGAGAYETGGSYGGRAGQYMATWPASPYGSLTNPVDPGSGGGSQGAGQNGGNGGGLVCVQASGNVQVDGAILAEGASSSGYGGGGSGGGISIACQTFGGIGTVSAKAATFTTSGRAGGGRIAATYNSGAQRIQPTSGVLFSADRGQTTGNGGSAADLGTLYFTDSQLIDGVTETVLRHPGQLFMNTTNWTANNLTVSNAWVRIGTEGFRLTVSNNLTLVGSGALLEVGSRYVRPLASYSVGQFDIVSATTNGPILQVGGNLVLTNSSALTLYAGLTNASSVLYGGQVIVGGTLDIETNCWVYPYSHYSNGGSVFFQVQNLTIATNAGIDASAKGWAGGASGSTAGFGTGTGKQLERGGGYGGAAGLAPDSGGGGITYGSSNAPALPGSGGVPNNGGTCGGDGGGLIWVRATHDITINGGTLNANGAAPVINNGGGGSGGGIYLFCHRFGGPSGLLSAQGGASPASGGTGGGGGRIAVWRQYDSCQFTNNIRYNGGTNTGAPASSGLTGTLYWGLIPPNGTIFTFQ